MDKCTKELFRAERRKAFRPWVRRGIALLCLFSIPILWLHCRPLVVLAPYLIVLGCILIGVDVAEFLSERLMDLIHPSRKGEITPIYSIPESFAAKGMYTEAETEYEKIIEQFPGEVRPHLGLIKMAVTGLQDLELADRLYIRGRDMLQDSSKKRELEKVYEGLRSMLEEDGQSAGITDLAEPKE